MICLCLSLFENGLRDLYFIVGLSSIDELRGISLRFSFLRVDGVSFLQLTIFLCGVAGVTGLNCDWLKLFSWPHSGVPVFSLINGAEIGRGWVRGKG